MIIDQTYDRDGKVIPDDWYDKEKYKGRQLKWGTQQRVGRTQATERYLVSTVWLMGIDHSWGDGPPMLFETMVFDEASDDNCDNDLTRYATEEAAMRGHLATVDAIRAGKPPFSWENPDA